MKLRERLLRLLAPDGRCARCAKKLPWKKLTVEHVDGISFDRRGMSQTARERAYWDEYGDGVRLAALCLSCNSAGGWDHRRRREDRASR